MLFQDSNRFRELHAEIFDVPCIQVKATPVIIQTLSEKIVVERDDEEFREGYDWLGNEMTITNDSSDLVAAIFNAEPLMRNNDSEAYDYSIGFLGTYSITIDKAIEIFDLTESLILTDMQYVHKLYEAIQEYVPLLEEKHKYRIHGKKVDISDDIEKMGNLLNWLRPVIQRSEGNWLGNGILAQFFHESAKLVGDLDLDKTDVVITQKLASPEPSDVVTFDQLMGL